MTWPASTDFFEAVQHPSHCFGDAGLRSGSVHVNALGLPRVSSGNFADVYQVVEENGKQWAVKCFTRPAAGLQDRYRLLDAYLRQTPFPFMVPFEFQPEGILVNAVRYPILKMQWVEGDTLNDFIRDNLKRSTLLEKLTTLWFKFAKLLAKSGLIHGDLQHGNVLLVGNPDGKSVRLTLVDYDATSIAGRSDTPCGEMGHAAYQHPDRSSTVFFGPQIDHFSILVIACALRCLALRGADLWHYSDGENLLFRQDDFESPEHSALFQTLWQINDPLTRVLVGRLALACKDSLANVRELSALVGVPENPVDLSRAESDRVSAMMRGTIKLPTPQPASTSPPPPSSSSVPADNVPWWVPDVAAPAMAPMENTPSQPGNALELDLKMGRFSAAVSRATAALRTSPRDNSLRVQRARAYEGLADISAAIKDYTAILHVEPTHARALAGRGRLFASQNRLAKAEVDLRAALSQGIDDEKLFRCLGDLLAARGKMSDALRVFDLGLAKHPQCYDLHFGRAAVHHGSGDHDAALVDLQACTALRPAEYPAFLRMGQVLLALNNLREARDVYTSALGLDFTDLAIFRGRIECNYKLGNWDACRFDLRKARSLAPDDPGLARWQQAIDSYAPRESWILAIRNRIAAWPNQWVTAVGGIVCILGVSILLLTTMAQRRESHFRGELTKVQALLDANQIDSAHSSFEELVLKHPSRRDDGEMRELEDNIQLHRDRETARAAQFARLAKGLREDTQRDPWQEYSPRFKSALALATTAKEQSLLKLTATDLDAERSRIFGSDLSNLELEYESLRQAPLAPLNERRSSLAKLKEAITEKSHRLAFVEAEIGKRHPLLLERVAAFWRETTSLLDREEATSALLASADSMAEGTTQLSDYFNMLDKFAARLPTSALTPEFKDVLATAPAARSAMDWSKRMEHWKSNFLDLPAREKVSRRGLLAEILPTHPNREAAETYREWLAWAPQETEQQIRAFLTGVKGPKVYRIFDRDRDRAPYYILDERTYRQAFKHVAAQTEIDIIFYVINYDAGTTKAKLVFVPKSPSIAPHAVLARDILALLSASKWRTWDEQMQKLLTAIEQDSHSDPIYRLVLFREMCDLVSKDHIAFEEKLRPLTKHFRAQSFDWDANWMDPDAKGMFPIRASALAILKAAPPVPRLKDCLQHFARQDVSAMRKSCLAPHGYAWKDSDGKWNLRLAKTKPATETPLFVIVPIKGTLTWRHVGTVQRSSWRLEPEHFKYLKRGMPIFLAGGDTP